MGIARLGGATLDNEERATDRLERAMIGSGGR
jgi:hypothetical protein